LQLQRLWAEDRPRLGVGEVADWFAAYAYLPKLRDRVALETAVREALSTLDPSFACADAFDSGVGRYLGVKRSSAVLDQIAKAGVLVRPEGVIGRFLAPVSRFEVELRAAVAAMRAPRYDHEWE